MHHIYPPVELQIIFYMGKFIAILLVIQNIDPVSYAAVVHEASDMVFYCILSAVQSELVLRRRTYFYFLGSS
jgi:hypothetical protein